MVWLGLGSEAEACPGVGADDSVDHESGPSLELANHAFGGGSVGAVHSKVGVGRVGGIESGLKVPDCGPSAACLERRTRRRGTATAGLDTSPSSRADDSVCCEALALLVGLDRCFGGGAEDAVSGLDAE